MFERPVVLVLGAGASAPMGFPLGPALIDNIVKGAQHASVSDDLTFRGAGPRELDFVARPYSALLNFLLTERPHFVPPNFTQSNLALKGLAEQLHVASHQSIDDFARTNPSMRALVKMIVALEIGKATFAADTIRENRIVLNPHIFASSRNTWYGRLATKLREDCNNASECHQNKLAVVTFNYDTSLDVYLDTELRRAELFRDVQPAKVVEIVHVHGRVAFQFPQDGKHIAYHYAAALSSAAEKLIMVGDVSNENNEEILRARALLADAERIYVLGFDMHPNNVQLIGLGDPAIARKVILLNWNGTQRVANRALGYNVFPNNIWKGTSSRPLEIAQAIDDGLFETAPAPPRNSFYATSV